MTEVLSPSQQQPHTETEPTAAQPDPQPEIGTGTVDDSTEADAKLASNLAEIIERALEKLEPILKMINEHMEKASTTPKEDFDKEKFIEQVQPLLEQATNILNETNGAIKGLDPKGELSKNAQRKSADHKATAEEQRLAQALTKLTGDVTKTIENARKKIKDMPKAGPKLGPLLDLLQDPLFQILSGIGILLNGVLTLVGNLLDSLGLGGIVRNLLAGLGLEKILKSLGLGKFFEKKDK